MRPLALALAACVPVDEPVAELALTVCGAASIQAAIEDAPDGATITVCDGTWRERLTIDGKALTLRSAHGADVTILDAEQLGVGVAIRGGADVTIEGFAVVNGVSTGVGGDVSCFGSTLALTRSVLEGGLAPRGGGLGASGCVLDLLDVQLVANHATGDEGGGGAWLSDCDGSVADVDFVGNSAYQGGGAWIAGDGVTVTSSTFRGNAADVGGGAFLDGSTSLLDSVFAQNTAATGGAGVYASGFAGELTGNAFLENRADDDGGGVYLDGGAGAVTANRFEGNEAGGDGGGLRVKLSTARVTDNTFTANTAVQSGGAAKVSHAPAMLRGNVFRANTAWKGGALALDESASALVGDAFERNVAGTGGGLFVSDGWEGPVLEDCVFTSNVASSRGGNIAIELLPGIRTLLRRVELISGAADLGGGLYASDSDVELINTTVRANTATTGGGGVYLIASTGTFANSLLWANDAPAGSGVLVADGGAVVIGGTIVGRNSTGAAVEVLSANAPTLEWSDVYANANDFAGTQPSRGIGALSVAPGFVDESAFDFTLAASSPLIDAAEPGLFDDDGSPADIGVHGGPYATGP